MTGGNMLVGHDDDDDDDGHDDDDNRHVAAITLCSFPINLIIYYGDFHDNYHDKDVDDDDGDDDDHHHHLGKCTNKNDNAHVLAHLLKSFRAYNVKSSNLLFSDKNPMILRILPKQNTAVLSSVCLCVCSSAGVTSHLFTFKTCPRPYKPYIF